jgi:hypothetical protein
MDLSVLDVFVLSLLDRGLETPYDLGLNYAGLVKAVVQVEPRVHRHASRREVEAEHALLLRGCDDWTGRLEEAA